MIMMNDVIVVDDYIYNDDDIADDYHDFFY